METKLIIKGHQNSINWIDISKNGDYLATCSEDKTAIIWDIENGEIIQKFDKHQDAILGISISPDFQMVATASKDKTAIIWDLKTGNVINTLKKHKNYVKCVQFSRNGKSIATCSDDNSAIIWNLDGKIISVLKEHTNWINQVTFSYDDQLIATGSHDKTAIIWKDYKVYRVFQDHEDWVKSVAFASNMTQFATGSQDCKVRIFDIESSNLIKMIQNHQSYISQVLFCEKSNFIGTASYDNTAMVWSNRYGNLVFLYDQQDDWVRSISFQSDNKRFALGLQDSRAIVYSYCLNKKSENYFNDLIQKINDKLQIAQEQIIQTQQFGFNLIQFIILYNDDKFLIETLEYLIQNDIFMHICHDKYSIKINESIMNMSKQQLDMINKYIMKFNQCKKCQQHCYVQINDQIIDLQQYLKISNDFGQQVVQKNQNDGINQLINDLSKINSNNKEALIKIRNELDKILK